jgi:Fic family protein
MTKKYQPPFTLTNEHIDWVSRISEQIGLLKSNHSFLTPQLRRGNRIRTIQASLAIEQNTLSLEQVTAVIEGKPVLGLPHEIQEVRNAFATYEQLQHFNPCSIENLLKAHSQLLYALADDAGKWRETGVAIYNSGELMHMPPSASQVPRLMDDLFAWLNQSNFHPLLTSCLFHYEFEFIHPFSDGNGRMGRLWQTLILTQWRPELAYLPVETVIKDRQGEYYRALREADKLADAAPFVSFMLEAIGSALSQALEKSSGKSSVKSSGKNSEKVLQLIRGNSLITASDIAEHLGISVRAVEKQLANLKTAGKLNRVGGAKGGHWVVIVVE